MLRFSRCTVAVARKQPGLSFLRPLEKDQTDGFAALLHAALIGNRRRWDLFFSLHKIYIPCLKQLQKVEKDKAGSNSSYHGIRLPAGRPSAGNRADGGSFLARAILKLMEDGVCM